MHEPVVLKSLSSWSQEEDIPRVGLTFMRVSSFPTLLGIYCDILPFQRSFSESLCCAPRRSTARPWKMMVLFRGELAATPLGNQRILTQGMFEEFRFPKVASVSFLERSPTSPTSFQPHWGVDDICTLEEVNKARLPNPKVKVVGNVWKVQLISTNRVCSGIVLFFLEVLILLIFMGEGKIFRISWNINHSKGRRNQFLCVFCTKIAVVKCWPICTYKSFFYAKCFSSQHHLRLSVHVDT